MDQHHNCQNEAIVTSKPPKFKASILSNVCTHKNASAIYEGSTFQSNFNSRSQLSSNVPAWFRRQTSMILTRYLVIPVRRFNFLGNGLQNARRKTFSERRLLGYPMECLYEVVSKVEDYNKFLPACYKSVVTSRKPGLIVADLEIGFPPLIVEKYTSHVTLMEPKLVKARCLDGRLFHHLVTEWKFSPGLPNNPKTCTLDFHIDFEFKSELYSRLTNSIFDEMVRQTVNAFLKRVEELHGKPSIRQVD